MEWRATLKRRIVVAATLLGLWVAGIEGRLVYLQVFHHADLMARAARQQSRTLPTPAKRGDILDRRGHVAQLEWRAMLRPPGCRGQAGCEQCEEETNGHDRRGNLQSIALECKRP